MHKWEYLIRKDKMIMNYSKNDTKKLMQKVIEELKSNPKCDISDEVLMQKYAEYTQDDHLEILTKMINVMENEKNKEE